MEEGRAAGGDRAVKPARAWPRLLLRLILGGAFLLAGLMKVSDPAHFAQAIAAFQILPASLVPATALSLPFLEIAIGALLLAGRPLRCAAFSAMILAGIYTAALAWGLARHRVLECDCFGTSTSAPHALLRDVLLLAAAVALYILEFNRARGTVKPYWTTRGRA